LDVLFAEANSPMPDETSSITHSPGAPAQQLIVGVPIESFPAERRVALVPASVGSLTKARLRVLIQTGAGVAAGFADAAYLAQGAELVSSREALFQAADIVLQVRTAGANPTGFAGDLALLRSRQTLIGLCEPLSQPAVMQQLAERGVTMFSLELLPRITRAQSMDVLSSQANIAGYKAVLVAASHLSKLFPMLMTAAGTLTAARVFVIGAGVAGLQAIATARRLGASVKAYDVRPAVREEVQSLGARFVEIGMDAAGAGGYAKAMDEEFYRRQREALTPVVAESDVVITTAVIPGKRAPTLVTRDMVEKIAAGSVLVDLAAEQGGNCELTQPGESITPNGVTIVGCVNLAATVPLHASQTYSRNITTFLLSLVQQGRWAYEANDEIVASTLITRDGQIVNARVKELLASL
jgi:NAD(P) transhydrogenase subunit alpha